MVRALARRVGLRRSTIAALRLRTEREFWSRWPSTPDLGPRILCYHAVGTPSWGYNDISPERFRRHLELALANGHRFVPASQIAQGEGGAQDLAITFDDGLTSVARYAAPIMADMKVPWTMFVVTDWCSGHHDFGSGAILDWTGVQEIVAAGASVGSHSVTHPDFGRLSPGEVVRELTESRQLLSEHLGQEIPEFAIPFGQSRNWNTQCQGAALEAGYSQVYAQAQKTRTPGTAARTFVTGIDDDRIFTAALAGAFDHWEEWY